MDTKGGGEGVLVSKTIILTNRGGVEIAIFRLMLLMDCPDMKISMPQPACRTLRLSQLAPHHQNSFCDQPIEKLAYCDAYH